MRHGVGVGEAKAGKHGHTLVCNAVVVGVIEKDELGAVSHVGAIFVGENGLGQCEAGGELFDLNGFVVTKVREDQDVVCALGDSLVEILDAFKIGVFVLLGRVVHEAH